MTDSNRIIFQHVFNKNNPHGGATFCVEVDFYTLDAQVGVSLCCEKDMYSRKVGREISSDRVSKGEGIAFTYNPAASMLENVCYALSDFSYAYLHSKTESPKNLETYIGALGHARNKVFEKMQNVAYEFDKNTNPYNG